MIGFGFAAHGYAKLSKEPDGFAAILQTLGIPAPGVMAWLTALSELFGGLALKAGALVPIVSVPLAIIMLVAMFTIHLPYGFSSIKLMGLTDSRSVDGSRRVGREARRAPAPLLQADG
jgi:putative oxidoreductase